MSMRYPACWFDEKECLIETIPLHDGRWMIKAQDRLYIKPPKIWDELVKRMKKEVDNTEKARCLKNYLPFVLIQEVFDLYGKDNLWETVEAYVFSKPYDPRQKFDMTSDF